MRVVPALVVSILACLAAFAQQVPEFVPEEQAGETFEPVRRYTVEFIVFSYGDGVSTGNETWLPEEPAMESGPDVPAYYRDRRSRLFDDDEPIPELELPVAEFRYMESGRVLLDAGEYTMDGIYDKLEQLDAYEPMMRGGWTQATFEKEITEPIDLRLLGEPPRGLEGKLTLYLGRFLHLVVELTLTSDRSASVSPRNDEASFGDARTRDDYGVVFEFGGPPPLRYRIEEDRIMKSGDIRYFDHPKFGVIAKVTRFEEPEEEIFDDTTDLLPGNSLSR